MNLATIGLSALNASQKKLSVAAHNINNANTEGYNRQVVLTSTAGATATGSGYYGRGVVVDTVTRAYNDFLSRQLLSSQSRGEALTTYGSQIAQVNNLLADRTVGISPAIQNFFDAVQAMASSPADPAARQDVISRSETLAAQFNSVNQFLNERREDVNLQVKTLTSQINSYAERIAVLNQEITVAQATSGHAPNDLLDQRDLEIAELNKLVDVKVLNQDGQTTITIGNGQLLVSGTATFKVQAKNAADNPRNLTLYIEVPAGASGRVAEVPLNEASVTGGMMGGLLTYRRESLDPTQQQLGQLAAGMALSVNEVLVQGTDLHGNPGQPLFNIGQPEVFGRVGNTGNSTLSASYNLNGASQLKASDYKVEFDGSSYTVTRLSDKTQVFYGANLDGAQFDGMTIAFSGTPNAGDSWTILPTSQAASRMQTMITAPDELAAASAGGGSANGENALKLAALQTSKILSGGSMSFNESFSQIVNRVGVQSQQNTAQSKAQAALIQQNYDAQQAVSGVNLNEEYINIDRYMEQFAAASRLIEVSASLFDTLLSIKA